MTNKKNDSFEPNKDLNELMNSATEKVDDSVEIQKEPRSIVFTVVIAVVLLAIVLLASVKLLTPQEFEDKTLMPTTQTGTPTKETTKESEVVSKEIEYPVSVPDWSKQAYEEDFFVSDKGIRIIKQEVQKAEAFSAEIAWLPSGILLDVENPPPAHTNDPDEKTIDGVLNPYYSYTLKEDYEKAYVTYLQRLINPVFGEWITPLVAPDNQENINTPASLKENNVFLKLKDVFSHDWWDEHIVEGEDYSKLPILADWDKEVSLDIIGTPNETIKEGLFFGVINETEENKIRAENIGTDENGQVIIEVITPIKYVAFDENKLKTRSGEISMQLSSNKFASLTNRVIISKIELILE